MRYLRRYVDSIFFPLTLGLLALIGWTATYFTGDQSFYWAPAAIFSVLAFAPLLGRDGRGYLALIILLAPIVSSPLSFANIEPAMIVMTASTVVSVVAFLLIRRPAFHLGRLFYPIMLLLLIFAASALFDLTRGGELHRESFWFLAGMVSIFLLYLLIVPMIYEDRVFDYLSGVLAVFAGVLAVEIFCFLGRSDSQLVSGIKLGWAQSSTMASTLLVCSLPFSCMMIKEPGWPGKLYLLPLALALAGIFLLKTVSGLLATILILIPLIFLVFRSYRYYPYLVIAALVGLIGSTALLFVFDENYFNLMLDSLAYLRSFFSGSIAEHRLGIEMFVQAPIVGPSINSLYDLFGSGKGYIRLLDNTVVTTLVMGGSLGLAAYAAHMVNLYALVFQRRNPNRYFFLLFLLISEVIGLIDNTLYNLMYMFIFFLTVASYENSSRRPQIVVRQKYFSNYANKR